MMTVKDYLKLYTVKDYFEEAAAHIQGGRHNEALALFNTVLERHPCHPLAVGLAGNVMSMMGNHGVAIALQTLASQLTKGSPDTMGNLAVALRSAGLYEEAIEVGEQCLKRIDADAKDWPEDALAAVLGNLAGAFVNQGCPGKGIPHGRRSVELQAKTGLVNHSNENNLGLLYLEAGQWTAGWKYWQSRFKTKPYDQWRHYKGERWQGQPVDSLVVHGEQGLGDEIMFLGCMEDVLPLVSGRVVIECSARLKTIVARSFPTCEVITKESELPEDCAAWIAMGDVPALFRGGRPPRREGYIVPDGPRVDQWAERFRSWGEHSPSFVLGGRRPVFLLATWGGTKATHDAIRNPPPEAWEPVVRAVHDVRGSVYSIQYKHGLEHANILGVPFLEEAATDLEEQLACLAAADGLISVPQTALHFAGALGKPTLAAISSRPAWRYGVRGEMPWYKQVKLIRAEPLPQKEGERRQDDWPNCMRRIAWEISKWH